MTQRRHVWQDAPWDALERFQAFCDERGITMLEATFGWLLVAAGAVERDRRRDERRAGARRTRAAATAWTPSADDLELIDALFPLVGGSRRAGVTRAGVRSERTDRRRSRRSHRPADPSGLRRVQ